MRACILIALLGAMTLSAVVLGVPHHEVVKRRIVDTIPTDFKKDPWLVPKIGVLASEHSPVYSAVRGDDGRVEFQIVPDAMRMTAEFMLTREEYRQAYAENVNNPEDNVIQTQEDATPLPESGSRPGVLYPEIMAVVTYDLYQQFHEDIWEIIPYVLAFWNGVDMLYRGIENPAIRLNVAGIIIETEDQLLKYTKHHSINDTILDFWALYESRSFWYKQKDEVPLESYDAIVTMSTLRVCSHIEGPCNYVLEGQSWLGTICLSDDSSGVIDKTLIIYDNGRFGGIGTAAHELGHALGMNHDDQDVEPNEAADLRNCKIRSGIFIMSSSAHINVFRNRWSQCSMDYLDGALEKYHFTCLYNTPAIGEIHVPRLLPGQLASTDEQCRANGYGNSCVKLYDRISPCHKLSCYEDGYCSSIDTPAAEGTPCDDEDPTKFCMFGECVSGSEFV